MAKPTNRELKSELYQQLALVTKALSNPGRLEILDLIAQGPFPVEYIAEHTNLPIANTSQHLQVLKQSGLVEVHKQGKYSFYQLAGSQVLETWHSLRKLAFALNPEIGSLLTDFRKRGNAPEIVTVQQINELVHGGNALLLDVRPQEEFETGHIEYATSIPAKYLRTELHQLPKDKEIIVYCRGPLCLMADEAVKVLTEKGFKARRLDAGFAEWTQYESVENKY